jgi:hypothetical protein
VLIIIISVTVCCISILLSFLEFKCFLGRRRRLALQKRIQAANRSALDPIGNTTQFNNTSFQQQNTAYMQDRSFNPHQYGQTVNPQLGFGQPVPQYNQFIQPQLQPQPQQSKNFLGFHKVISISYDSTGPIRILKYKVFNKYQIANCNLKFSFFIIIIGFT